MIKSGTPSPNPWDLSLWGQNGLYYTDGTGTEDKAPQGCALSAHSSAGMVTGGCGCGRPNLRITTPSSISLFKAKNGLDNGVHFIMPVEIALGTNYNSRRTGPK